MDTRDLRAFHEFEINLGTGELRRDGEPVALERQPALALALLVRNPGRLVTRAELRAAIWPAGTHVDFDRGLNYCLRQIRIALGDDARAPRFIETVPRQGYRFLAPGLPLPKALTGPARRRQWRTRVAAAMTAAVVVGAVVVESGPKNEDHHRLAVRFAHAVHDFLF